MAKTCSGDANRAARYSAPQTIRARQRARSRRLALCAAGDHEWIDAGLRELICSHCNAWREREPPALRTVASWLEMPHAWIKDAPSPARWKNEIE